MAVARCRMICLVLPYKSMLHKRFKGNLTKFVVSNHILFDVLICFFPQSSAPIPLTSISIKGDNKTLLSEEIIEKLFAIIRTLRK